jgi:(R,R)-butanediol dehydrogenase/meso-butanediol dehydrogenase/diacetyl reductase
VLVLGAGPIGGAAIYWARQAGAGRIAVSATSRRREAIAMAMGADNFIVPEDGRTLAEQTAEALGGPADLVIECAGVPGSLQLAVSAIRVGGTVVAPGFCWTPDSFMAVHALSREATIKYTNMYSRREFEIAVDRMDAGHVEPRAMVTRTVGLAQAPAVFAELLAGAPDCKVMIAPNA